MYMYGTMPPQSAFKMVCHSAGGIFHLKRMLALTTYSWEAGQAETNRQDDTL